MTQSQSPFLKKNIVCPACKKPSQQRFFRHRAFVPQDKESDQHVLSYKWLSKNVEPVHPPFYHFYFCPLCFFSESSEEYANMRKTDHGIRLVQAFNGADASKRALIELLGKQINYDEIDFHSALNIHLLAIVIQLLPKDDMVDSYKVGRFFLRAAWLYREQDPQNKEEAPEIQKVDQTPHLSTSLNAFQQALQNAQETWQTLRKQLPDSTSTIDHADSASKAGAIAQASDNLDKLFSVQFALIKTIGTSIKEVPAQKTVDAGQKQCDAFFSYPSYTAFLANVKKAWPDLPYCEIDALRMAVKYFQKSLSSDEKFDSPRAYAAGLALVTDLMERCNDLEEAFGIVRGIYRSSTDARLKCQQALKNKETDESEKAHLKVQIRRLNESIQFAGELRLRLMDKLIERDMPKLEPVIKQLKNAGDQEIEKALSDCGIAPGLVSRLREKGYLPQLKAEKKTSGFYKLISGQK